MLSLSNRHLRSSNNKTTQLLTTNHTQYLPEAMRAVKLRHGFSDRRHAPTAGFDLPAWLSKASIHLLIRSDSGMRALPHASLKSVFAWSSSFLASSVQGVELGFPRG